MVSWKEVLAWLERATGIGYRSLPPLEEEPERKQHIVASKKMRTRALSVSRELSRLERALRK
jgi:hypothetical protein